jgi:hypothetical protein
MTVYAADMSHSRSRRSGAARALLAGLFTVLVVGFFGGRPAYAGPSAADTPPQITSPTSDTETFAVPFDFTVTTAGSPAPALSERGHIPAGVTFVDNGDGTATISGTPARNAMGDYSLTISAKNPVGTTSETFTLSIMKAPTIKKIPNATGHVGSALAIYIAATGDTTPAITNAFVPLPDGLIITDNGDGTAVISGIPAAGSGGTYTIHIEAYNSVGASARAFSLKIDEGPVITSASTVTATIGSPFVFGVSASGFPAPRFRLSGALPKGVEFSAATGTLSGTPRPGSTGSYHLTIAAKNSTATVTQNFSLIVE